MSKEKRILYYGVLDGQLRVSIACEVNRVVLPSTGQTVALCGIKGRRYSYFLLVEIKHRIGNKTLFI